MPSHLPTVGDRLGERGTGKGFNVILDSPWGKRRCRGALDHKTLLLQFILFYLEVNHLSTKVRRETCGGRKVGGRGEVGVLEMLVVHQSKGSRGHNRKGKGVLRRKAGTRMKTLTCTQKEPGSRSSRTPLLRVSGFVQSHPTCREGRGPDVEEGRGAGVPTGG